MSVDDLFGLTMNPLELVLRGTLMYWALFLVFRFILRRDVGAVGIADILLLVLIADAAQNAMAGGYETVTEGLILVGTIVGWNWLLDWASFHSPAIARLVVPPPLVLVRHGRLIERNLRAEHLTREELMSKIRAHGTESLLDIKVARLEPDGDVTVIRYDGRE
jgi:uncharacterized membrane protein YcaP (DUF421 family)